MSKSPDFDLVYREEDKLYAPRGLLVTICQASCRVPFGYKKNLFIITNNYKFIKTCKRKFNKRKSK